MTEYEIIMEARTLINKHYKCMQGAGRTNEKLEIYKQGQLAGINVVMSLLRQHGILKRKRDTEVHWVFCGDKR